MKKKELMPLLMEKVDAPAAPEISALANEAAALDAAASPAAEDGNASSPDAAPPVVSTAEMLRPLLKVTFDLLAPNWKVEEKESDALCDAYAAVLDKYFPDGVVGRWGVEINALLITVAIIGPRIKIPPRDTPKKEDDQQPLDKAA